MSWRRPGARLTLSRRRHPRIVMPSPLVPELDSAQFSALMDSHQRATQDRTPLVRSATTPPVTTRAGFSLAGTAPRPLGMHRTRSLPLPNSVEPCLLESHMLPATDAFPDMTPAGLRHTQAVIGDHFSDIDEDEQEDEATSKSLDMGIDADAQPRTDGVSVIHGVCDDTVAQMTADVATPVVSTDDAFSDADPHRNARAGSCSASRLSTATPPTAGDTTEMAAPVATTLRLRVPPTAPRRLPPLPPTRVWMLTRTRARPRPAFPLPNTFLRSFVTYGGVRMIRRPVWSCMLLLSIRVLVWPWARLLMSPSRWSPPTPPSIWMSALPMICLLMLSTLIQPRPGVMVVRPQQR